MRTSSALFSGPMFRLLATAPSSGTLIGKLYTDTQPSSAAPVPTATVMERNQPIYHTIVSIEFCNSPSRGFGFIATSREKSAVQFGIWPAPDRNLVCRNSLNRVATYQNVGLGVETDRPFPTKMRRLWMQG